MKITVVVSTWQVPFDQVVNSVTTFDGPAAEAEALAFTNAESLKWWQANHGDECRVKYPDTEAYVPVGELGYHSARYLLWGGEVGFQAMIDRASYAALNEAHYQREFTDKGQELPGYLQVAKVQGNWPK